MADDTRLPAVEGLPVSERYLYFGNLLPYEKQYVSGMFAGLALVPRYANDIRHDARDPLPFADGSVPGFQSQDVFEHFEYSSVPRVLDEIYRCLRPGGLFRLSRPDYNSPLLRGRAVYDDEGRILCDVAMGGRLACKLNERVTVSFPAGGDAHVWFPTYDGLLRLLIASDIRRCASIEVHHAWFSRHEYVCKPFDQSLMPVQRSPPSDMRAGGKPVSLVVDFVK